MFDAEAWFAPLDLACQGILLGRRDYFSMYDRIVFDEIAQEMRLELGGEGGRE
jgi:hypothetical protein